MQHVNAILSAVALLLVCAWAPHAHATDTTNIVRRLPVLVHVDAKGQVVGFIPCTPVRPALRRMIRKVLDTQIRQPIMDHGKPVDTEIRVNLYVVRKQLANGRTTYYLTRVSRGRVPSGNPDWPGHSPNDDRTQTGAFSIRQAMRRDDEAREPSHVVDDMNQQARAQQTRGAADPLATPSVN